MFKTELSSQPSLYETQGQWFIQHSGYETLCSALSLLNTLRSIDPTLPLSNQEIDELLNQVPLTEEVIEDFINKKGFESFKFPWPKDDNKKNTAVALGKYIADILADNPLYVRISSKLSKQKEETTVQSFADEEEHKDKLVVHRVFMKRSGDTIEVVDPYDPVNPEKFNIESEEDMVRLIAWTFSVHFDQNGKFTKNGLDTVIEILNDTIKFDRHSIFGIIQSGVKGIRKIQPPISLK